MGKSLGKTSSLLESPPEIKIPYFGFGNRWKTTLRIYNMTTVISSIRQICLYQNTTSLSRFCSGLHKACLEWFGLVINPFVGSDFGICRNAKQGAMTSHRNWMFEKSSLPQGRGSCSPNPTLPPVCSRPLWQVPRIAVHRAGGGVGVRRPVLKGDRGHLGAIQTFARLCLFDTGYEPVPASSNQTFGQILGAVSVFGRHRITKHVSEIT